MDEFFGHDLKEGTVVEIFSKNESMINETSEMIHAFETTGFDLAYAFETGVDFMLEILSYILF